MGGNAFPTPAQRLTTPHIKALFAYSQAKLAPLFPKGVDMLRHTLDKTDHGDIDLLCSCEWAGVGMKGLESGGIDYGAEDTMAAQLDHSLKLDTPSGADDDEAEAKKITEFRKAVAGALGATKWLRSGYEISTAVPCHLVPGAELGPPDKEVSPLDPFRTNS